MVEGREEVEEWVLGRTVLELEEEERVYLGEEKRQRGGGVLVDEEVAEEEDELPGHEPVCLESELHHEEHLLQSLLVLRVQTDEQTVSALTVHDQLALPLHRRPVLQQTLYPFLSTVVQTQQSQQEQRHWTLPLPCRIICKVQSVEELFRPSQELTPNRVTQSFLLAHVPQNSWHHHLHQTCILEHVEEQQVDQTLHPQQVEHQAFLVYDKEDDMTGGGEENGVEGQDASLGVGETFH